MHSSAFRRLLAPALILPLWLATSTAIGGTTPAHPASSHEPASPHEPAPSPIIAQIGGAMSNVVQVGDHAYVGVGPRVLVLDVSDPARPREVGRSDVLPNPIHHLAVRDTTLFAANGFLTALDIGDPAHPVVLGTLAAGARRVVLDGDQAYIVSGAGGFPNDKVVDIRDPRAMRKLSDLPPSSPRYDLLVHPDPAVRRAWGAYNVFLHVLDISDPAAVAKLAELDLAETDSGLSARRLATDGQFLFAASGKGLLVGRLDPSALGMQLSLPTESPVEDVLVAGPIALLIANGELRIVDITIAAQPTVTAALPVPGARTVSLLGGFAYVTGSQGLDVVDVRQPAAPRAGVRLPSVDAVVDIALVGDTAFVAAGTSGLAVVDLADRANPKLVAVAPTGFTAARVVVEGRNAYVIGAVAQHRGQLAIFDISQPATPIKLGAIATPGWATDLAVQGGFAYIAGRQPGLTVFDARTPSAPRLAGSTGEFWIATTVLVAGRTAYVVDRQAGLWIVDIADLAGSDVRIGVRLDTQAEARGLAMTGSTIFVTASQWPITRMFEDEWSQDVLPVDVSDPANPRVLPFLGVEVWSKDLLVADGRAYIASGRVMQRDFTSHAQLIVLRDVVAGMTDPRRWALDLPQVPTGIAVAGEHVVVADGDAGLLVVRVADETLDLPTATPTATMPPLPTSTRRPGEITETPLPTSTAPPIPGTPTGSVYLPLAGWSRAN